MNYRYTEQEVQELEARLKRGRLAIDMPTYSQLQAQQSPKKGKRRGEMNPLETSFLTEVLLPFQWAKKIDYLEYEPFTFRMANSAKYTPDFVTRDAVDNKLTAWECKGFWRPQARLRIKWAAQRFPMFKFVAVQRIKGVWTFENF